MHNNNINTVISVMVITMIVLSLEGSRPSFKRIIMGIVPSGCEKWGYGTSVQKVGVWVSVVHPKITPMKRVIDEQDNFPLRRLIFTFQLYCIVVWDMASYRLERKLVF